MEGLFAALDRCTDQADRIKKMRRQIISAACSRFVWFLLTYEGGGKLFDHRGR